MYMKGASFLFGDFMGGDKQLETLAPHMAEVPLINKAWTDDAVAAIRSLGVLCGGNPVEKKYHEMLLEMAELLYVSSAKAYKSMTDHYSWWMMLPHDQFQRVIDPANQVSILLATHWIALKQIMAIITETEKKGASRERRPPANKDKSGGGGGNNDIDLGICRWLKYLNQQVDANHVVYNQWPMWVAAQMDADRGYFGKTGTV
jgi:hypothetical protein